MQQFNLGFFNFMMVQKKYEYSKNGTLNSEFGSFPGPGTCGMILRYLISYMKYSTLHY